MSETEKSLEDYVDAAINATNPKDNKLVEEVQEIEGAEHKAPDEESLEKETGIH